jgi:ribosomal protein S27E
LASFLFYLVIVLAALGTGAVILAVRQTNRYFRAVTQATCVSCGAAFRRVTGKKAKTDFEEAFKKVLYENPGLLVNPTREWPVECPICGTRHKYLLDEKKILAEEVDVQGQ